MLRRFSTNFAIFSILVDGLMVAVSMALMSDLRIWMNRFSFIETIPGRVQFPAWLYVAFSLIWILVLAAFSIYDGKRFFKVVDELSTLTAASLTASVIQAGILYLTYREFSRALFLLIVFSTYLMCIFWRLISRVIFRLRKETLTTNQRILIVGEESEIRKIEKHLSGSLSKGSELVSNLTVKADIATACETPAVCPNTIQRIRKAVQQTGATDVVVAFSRGESEWIGAISSQLEDLPLGVWVALDYIDLTMAKTCVETLGGLPLLGLRAPALDAYSRILKRAFDLAAGLLILILISPLMAVIALAVLINDGRPVFFCQERVGENGRLFKMIKFRTMVKDAEKLRAQVERVDGNGNVVHKTRNDPRVTRLGRILRRFSLDELPQFINVIRGEMSLVGPRPELPYIAQNYNHQQRKRLTVPPGMTGWWQVNGRSDRVMHLHTEDDLYYVENYSIWLDLRILLRTLWVVIIGNGSF